MKIHDIKEKPLQDCVNSILDLSASLYEEYGDIELILKALNITQAIGIHNLQHVSAEEKLQMLLEQQQTLLNGFAILIKRSNKGEQK